MKFISRHLTPIFWCLKVELHGKRVKSHAKRTGILLPETTHSHNVFPLDTFKALDSMILSKLQLLQFGIPLQEAKFLVVDAPHFGFGASVLSPLSTGLAYSYLYDRVLLFNTNRLLYDFCYEPVSIHSLEEISREHYKGMAKFNFLPQKEKVVHSDSFQIFNSLVLPKFLNSVHPLSLPLSSIYIKGLILGSFLKLKQEYKAHIEEKKKEIGFDSPVIGVHIRQGALDIPSERHRLIPFQKYLEVIEETVDKTGIKTVFVTTDSEEVIQQLPRNSGMDFIYDDKEKRYSGQNVDVVYQNPGLRKQETLSSIKNIHLLAACDYIIGGPGNWFNNSLALSYFRNKKLNGILIKRKGVTIRRRKGYRVAYLTKGETNDYDIDIYVTNDDHFQRPVTEFSTDPFFN